MLNTSLFVVFKPKKSFKDRIFGDFGQIACTHFYVNLTILNGFCSYTIQNRKYYSEIRRDKNSLSLKTRKKRQIRGELNVSAGMAETSVALTVGNILPTFLRDLSFRS